MRTKSKNFEPPVIRLALTPEQCRELEKLGPRLQFLGYARRHPFPECETFTLIVWDVDPGEIEQAMEAAGILASPKGSKQKPKSSPREKSSKKKGGLPR